MDRKYIVNTIKYMLLFSIFEIVFAAIVHNRYGYSFLLFFVVSLILSAFLSILTSRCNRIIVLAVDIVLCLLLYLVYATEIIIFKTFGNCMPLIAAVSNASNVYNNFLDYAVENIYKNIIVLLILLIPLIYIILFNIIYKNIDRDDNNSDNIKTYFAIFPFLLLIILLIITDDKKQNFENKINNNGLFVTILQDFMPEIEWLSRYKSYNIVLATNSEISEDIYEKYNILNLDFDYLDNNVKSENIHNIDAYVKNQQPSNKNKYTGIFKNKNIILICAEAFSHNVIDKELTPTLYRMKYNGFNFTNYYQPSWGGSTSTGEFSYLLGLVPYDYTGSMNKTEENENNMTLPSILKNMGYRTFAFHNGSYTYYDRHKTHRNLGFEDYIAIGNKIESFTEDVNPEDDDMIKNTLKVYADYQPFCLYYMTISGHASYNKPFNKKVEKNIDRVRERYGDTLPNLIENYLCYQLYLEDALTEAIKVLSNKNLLNDTVFCITSDHYPHGLDTTVVDKTTQKSIHILPMLYKTDKLNKFETDKNELIIWSAALENELVDYRTDIDDVCYSLDILPTLLNLYGIDFDSRLLVGRDVFSDTPALVVYNNHSFITNNGVYDIRTGEFKSNDQNDSVSDEWIEYLKSVVYGKIEYSHLVLKTNYFKYLKYLKAEDKFH